MKHKAKLLELKELAQKLELEEQELRQHLRSGGVKAGKIKTEEGIKYDYATVVACPKFAEFMRDVCGTALTGWQNEAATAFLKVVKEEQDKSGSNYARGKTLLAEGLLYFINEHGNNFRL